MGFQAAPVAIKKTQFDVFDVYDISEIRTNFQVFFLSSSSKPASPKRDQARSEVSTPSPSSSSFLSPTVSIPDFEKVCF